MGAFDNFDPKKYGIAPPQGDQTPAPAPLPTPGSTPGLDPGAPSTTPGPGPGASGAFSGFDPQKYGIAPPAATTATSPDASSYLGGFGRTFDEAATLGAADYMRAHLANWARSLPGLGGLPGTTVEQERAKTAAASASMNPIARIATQAGGYAVGPGELKAGGRAAEFLAPYLSSVAPEAAAAMTRAGVPVTSGFGRWAGGALGAGAEGALAGGASTALHGGSMSDVATDAAFGGALGLGGGALGGVAGRPAKGQWLPAVPSTADLTTARQAAYGTLGSNIVFKGADVTRAMNDATSEIARKDIGGIGRSRAPDTMKAINAINDWAASPGAKTPSDLAQLQSDLMDIQRAGARAGTPDAAYSPIVAKALDDVMANATPVGGTGKIGDALVQLNTAKDAFKREANAKMLDEWARQSRVAGGPSMASQASAELVGEPKLYGRPGDVNYDALNRLAASDPGTESPFNIRHLGGEFTELGLKALAGGALGGAGQYALSGGHETNPWTGAAIGAAAMGGMPIAYRQAMQPIRQAAILRAEQAARQAMTTGVQAPQAATPLREALRTLLLSRAATGGNPLNF